MELLYYWLIFVGVAYSIGLYKERPVLGGFLGLLLGPIGILLIALVEKKSTSSTELVARNSAFVDRGKWTETKSGPILLAESLLKQLTELESQCEKAGLPKCPTDDYGDTALNVLHRRERYFSHRGYPKDGDGVVELPSGEIVVDIATALEQFAYLPKHTQQAVLKFTESLADQWKEELDEKIMPIKVAVNSEVKKYMHVLSRKYRREAYLDEYDTVELGNFEAEIEVFLSKRLPDIPAEIAAPLVLEAVQTEVDLSELQSPDDFSEYMSPLEYEQYCAKLIGEAGWTVRLTETTGDQGIDIIAELRNGPRKLDTAISEIFLWFQAANLRAAGSQYTASGVRRSSAL
jgi:hypothetical protein